MKKLKFGIFYIMLINLMGHSKWSWMNAYRNRYGLIRDDMCSYIEHGFFVTKSQ
jgi:hypothetical protein